jgi:hypothetical protein
MLIAMPVLAISALPVAVIEIWRGLSMAKTNGQ